MNTNCTLWTEQYQYCLEGFTWHQTFLESIQKNCWKQLYLWWNTLQTWRSSVRFPPCAFTTVIWTYSSSLYEVIKKIKHQGKRKRKIFPVEKENNSIPKRITYMPSLQNCLLGFSSGFFFLLVFLPLLFLFQQASLNHVQKMKISTITKLSFPSDKAGKKTYTTRHPEG